MSPHFDKRVTHSLARHALRFMSVTDVMVSISKGQDPHDNGKFYQIPRVTVTSSLKSVTAERRQAPTGLLFEPMSGRIAPRRFRMLRGVKCLRTGT